MADNKVTETLAMQFSYMPEELEKGKAFYNFTTQRPPNSEAAGVSVFYKDPTSSVFHAYSAYARGIDMLNAAYYYLDLAPKGRDETGHERPQFWVRRHDEYGR